VSLHLVGGNNFIVVIRRQPLKINNLSHLYTWNFEAVYLCAASTAIHTKSKECSRISRVGRKSRMRASCATSASLVSSIPIRTSAAGALTWAIYVNAQTFGSEFLATLGKYCGKYANTWDPCIPARTSKRQLYHNGPSPETATGNTLLVDSRSLDQPDEL